MTRRSRTFLTALALALGGAGPAMAAEISTRTVPELGGAAFVLTGEIQKFDSGKMMTKIEKILATEKSAQRMIVLDSPGGSLEDAMILGRYIHLRGFGTVVLPDGKCLSACADVFFAGYDLRLRKQKRVAFPNARIGVHQAYFKPEEKDERKKTLGEASLIYEDLQRRMGQRIQYQLEMGAAPGVVALGLVTKPGTIALVDAAQLRASDVVIPIRTAGGWTVEPSHADLDIFTRTGRALPAQNTGLPGAAAAPPPADQAGETSRAESLPKEPPPANPRNARRFAAPGRP